MHAKFTLKYTHQGSEDFSPADITFEIPSDSTISQMLYNFECFLKACGFVFDGKLEIVEPEEQTEGCMADWDAQFDNGLTTSSSPSDSKWNKADQLLKEWNEGIAKLDNEQKQKCREDAIKMSGLYDAALKETAKNNWVHGICNPPSPDWKKSK